MLQKVIRIDEEGYFLEDIFIDQGKILMEQVQVGEVPCKDEEGNTCTRPYELQPRKDIVYELPPHGLYKPKWTGTEWVEGLSQEEIDELTKPVSLDPRDEKLAELEKQNLDTMIALTSVFEENIQFKAKNAELEQGQVETMLARCIRTINRIKKWR